MLITDKNGWNRAKRNWKRKKLVTQHISVSVKNSFSVLNEIAYETEFGKAGNCINVNAVKNETMWMPYSRGFCHNISMSFSKEKRFNAW
jgi:hypothetical protein